MAQTPQDNPPPRGVIVASALVALGAAVSVVLGVLAVLHASTNADSFLRDHPDVSRTAALSGSYGAALVLVTFAAVSLFAVKALLRGRRWAWVVLVVLAVFDLPALFQNSALGVSAGLASVAVLVALVLPDSRRHAGVGAEPAPAG